MRLVRLEVDMDNEQESQPVRLPSPPCEYDSEDLQGPVSENIDEIRKKFEENSQKIDEILDSLLPEHDEEQKTPKKRVHFTDCESSDPGPAPKKPAIMNGNLKTIIKHSINLCNRKIWQKEKIGRPQAKETRLRD